MKLKITIPDSLMEIPLWRFQEYERMKGDEEDVELIAKLLVSNFCNIPIGVVDRIDVATYHLAVDTLSRVLTESPRLKKRFKWDGVEYGFIPNLDKMTMAEFVDCDTYISRVDQWHRLMTIFYRPIKKKFGKFYTIEDYEGSEKHHKIMKKVPLYYLQSAMVFFWSIANKLAIHTLQSSESNLKEEQVTRLNNLLLTSGGGINQSTDLLRAMFLDLRKSPL